jgi:uncharacterized protein (DUF427 family)
MVTASWKGKVIAQSNDTVVVEGNHYFPESSVNQTLLRGSDHHTTCGWKGVASYKSIEVDGEVNENAAWYYPDPKPQAEGIRGRFAFWKGVTVEGDAGPDQAREDAVC